MREAAIERALAPLKRLFPARTIERMREQMREYATAPLPDRAASSNQSVSAVKDSDVRGDGDESGSVAPLRTAEGKR